MRALRYTEAARDDLSSIAVYIADQSGSRAVAEHFIQTLQQKCEHLAALPGTLGTARPDLRPDLRSTPCRGYMIFFRYDGAGLEIVNVLHGSRDVLAHLGDE